MTHINAYVQEAQQQIAAARDQLNKVESIVIDMAAAIAGNDPATPAVPETPVEEGETKSKKVKYK